LEKAAIHLGDQLGRLPGLKQSLQKLRIRLTARPRPLAWDAGSGTFEISLPHSLAEHPPLLKLRAESLIREWAAREFYAHFPSALVVVAQWIFELQQFAFSHASQRQAMIAFVRHGLQDPGAARVFETTEAVGYVGVIPELLAFCAQAPSPHLAGVRADIQALRQQGVPLEPLLLSLVLFKEFGFPDALGEYTQRKWLYHEPQLLATLEQRWRDLRPVTVDIVPSLDCPQDCLACSNADWRKNTRTGGWHNQTEEERRMSPETMTRVIERVAASGAKAVVFTGGGEPLENPATVDGILLARRLGLEVGLYTNGILLTPERVSQFIRAQVTFIRFSINAGTSAVHAQVGGYDPQLPKFNQVLAMLRLLASQKKAAGSACTLGISFIINPWNVQDLLPLAQALHALELDPETRGGVDYLTIRPSLVHRGYRGGKQFDEALFHTSHRIIESQVRPLFASSSLKILEIENRFQSVHDREKPFARCTSTPWFGAVGPDGRMYLCAESYYGHERICLGDLNRQELPEIFSGAQAQSVIASIDFATCPPVCKMHELNKWFEQFNKAPETVREPLKHWLRVYGRVTPAPRHVNFI
jgi:MoaA/NifB/PqqE/SkfB family radical SAM enzyme